MYILAVYEREVRPEGHILPTGVDCYAWQYNMFLTPACSCIYLSISPYDSEVCGGKNINKEIVLTICRENDLEYLDLVYWFCCFYAVKFTFFFQF